MSSLSLSLKRISGAMPVPAHSATQSWSQRDVVLVSIEDAMGRRGIGEVAPLPGYGLDGADADNRETLSACEDALQAHPLAKGAADDLDSIAADVAKIPTHLPAARFGLECALLDLLGQRRECGIAELLREAWRLDDGLTARGSRPPLAEVPRCALLRNLREADTAFARGVRTFKLKWPAEDDQILALLASLKQRFPACALRADANGSWSKDHAEARATQLDPHLLEFVEEIPGCSLPRALDETLASASVDAVDALLRDDAGIRALVLKPTRLGGLIASLRWARLASERGRAAIASHCFEGAVGTAAVAELAVALQQEQAAGVDVHAALQVYSANLPPQLARPGVLVSHHSGLGVTPG